VECVSAGFVECVCLVMEIPFSVAHWMAQSKCGALQKEPKSRHFQRLTGTLTFPLAPLTCYSLFETCIVPSRLSSPVSILSRTRETELARNGPSQNWWRTNIHNGFVSSWIHSVLFCSALSYDLAFSAAMKRGSVKCRSIKVLFLGATEAG
jgi:hypothetical protein